MTIRIVQKRVLLFFHPEIPILFFRGIYKFLISFIEVSIESSYIVQEYSFEEPVVLFLMFLVYLDLQIHCSQ